MDAPAGALPDPGTPSKNHEAYYVPGLQRGLRVLELVAAAQRPMTVSEVAEALSITRSSAFRLVHTLRDMGFLDAVPNAKSVRLGPRVLSIGFAYLASLDMLEVARPELEVLRDNTNVTAHLAIRDGQELLYLSCVQTRSGFLSTMNVGARLPAYGTPMGWLLLMDLPKAELAALHGGTRFTSLSEHTPTSLDALETRLRVVARDGLVIAHGSFEAGGSSIAAPVRDSSGRVVAAIDIAGPDSAFDPTGFDSRYATEVAAAAARISRRLGYSGRSR